MPADSPTRRVLCGFGRATGSAAGVRSADTVADVSGVLSAANGRGVLARGLGRSYGDAAQNGGGVVVRLEARPEAVRLDRDTGIVHASAGTDLDALLRLVVPRGWFVPVTPGTRQVTLGGALAADVHGKNHHRDGSLASHVTSFRLAAPAGVRDVTPDRDADVFWATAGGMGLTGVVVDLALQLLPITTSRVLVDTERADDLDDLMGRMTARDHEYRYSVAWLDTSVGGRHLGRGVLTRGDHASVEDLGDDVADPLAYDPHVLATVPPSPLRLVRPATIRAFNAAWYARAPSHRVGEAQPLARFFHPLDMFHEWNRLYGPRGFVQYQFVVPYGSADVVRRVVEALVDQGMPSGMAVLKRFGQGNAGPLSFPMPGWTLALDLPVGPPQLRRTLARFDHWVAEVGGRVYLAKDACLTPEVFASMYPRLPEWRQVRDQLDPDHVLQSDLARRLQLTEARQR